jgi:hypothetical protein
MKGRELGASGDELAVLSRPRNSVGVVGYLGTGDGLHHMASFLSIALSTCRTWYVLALPLSFWILRTWIAQWADLVQFEVIPVVTRGKRRRDRRYPALKAIRR